MAENEARGLDFRPPGGESPREVIERIRPWLRDIANAAVPTLAVTHRGVIRAILAEATGWDMRGKPPAKLDWQAVHVFTADPHGRPSVERLNVR
jgi:probable phosphoglycerate mutase